LFQRQFCGKSPDLRVAAKRDSRNLMRTHKIILTNLIILSFYSFSFCQVDVRKENKDEEIDTLDENCLKEIKRAKEDIKNNKIVFTRIFHLIDLYPRKFEMDSLLKQSNISVVEGYGSCFHTPGIRKHCYKEEMDKEISKRFGSKFIDSIYDIAERIYVQKHINDTFKYEDCDRNNSYYKGTSPRLRSNDPKVKNYSNDFFKDFEYPVGFKYKNEKNYSYSSVYFYLLKDGTIGELEIETTFQNQENDNFKKQIEDKIKEFVLKTKWKPNTAKGIAVNSIMELTFFYK
jgi:hypothetical protein